MSEVTPKKVWQSKTVWVALVVAILPFVPAVKDVIGDNPESVGAALGTIFMILRMVTKDKIVIS